MSKCQHIEGQVNRTYPLKLAPRAPDEPAENLLFSFPFASEELYLGSVSGTIRGWKHWTYRLPNATCRELTRTAVLLNHGSSRPATCAA